MLGAFCRYKYSMLLARSRFPAFFGASSRTKRGVCTCAAPHMEASVQYDFGPWKIRGDEVFVKTPLSFAFVNLKPVVPGHVLVSSLRVVKRFADLTGEEVTDMWLLAQKVGKVAEAHFGGESLTMAIQDGPLAGQTVPHVHIHILPRRAGDFAKNDEVYDAIDEASKSHAPKSGEALDLDKERQVRTPEEMAAEAAELRKYFTAS